MNPSAVDMFHGRVNESWEIFPVNKILACYPGYFCKDYESLYPLEPFNPFVSISCNASIFRVSTTVLKKQWLPYVMTEICYKIRTI